MDDPGTPFTIREITVARSGVAVPPATLGRAMERALARVLSAESDRLLTAALLGIPEQALRERRLTVAEALADEQGRQRALPVAPGAALLVEDDQ
jgi:hypothetical protein